MYALAVQAAGATLVLADSQPRDAAMPLGHDLAAITRAITPRTRLVYLANPNNPDGRRFAARELLALLDARRREGLGERDEVAGKFLREPRAPA